MKKIFILSGINDLFFFTDPNFSRRFPGPQVYGHELYNIKKEHLNFFTRIKFFFENNKKHVIDEKIKLQEIIDRNLKLWSIFSKSQNVEVFFFLQPFYSWISDNLESNLDNFDYGKSEIMEKLDKSYDLIKKITKDACIKNNINFKDLNELSFGKEKTFVDRVHLNDKGFEKIANELIKFI